MSERMMTVDEAREWVAQDKSSRNTVSAARTIIAQAEQIGRLQATIRSLSYPCAGDLIGLMEKGILLPGDMEARHD